MNFKAGLTLTMLITATVAFGVYVTLTNDRPDTTDQSSTSNRSKDTNTTDQLVDAADGSSTSAPESEDPVSVSNATSKGPEIVRSIYDFDRDFTDAAQQAAEQYIAVIPHTYISRWKAISLDVESFLSGSYLEDGAIARKFILTPFPDKSFVVTESTVSVMEDVESVVWRGILDGTQGGRVEITIVGGIDNPYISMKIFEDNELYSIVPTEVPGAYVAIKGNQHELNKMH